MPNGTYMDPSLPLRCLGGVEPSVVERTNHDERLKTLKQVRRWVRSKRTKARNQLESTPPIEHMTIVRLGGELDTFNLLDSYVEGMIREMVD